MKRLALVIVVCLLKYSVSAQIIMTVAGGGTSGLGDGGPATAAMIGYIGVVCMDSTGNVYIGDGNNNRIRKYNPSTGIINTYAGTGTAGMITDGDTALNANLNSPGGITIDSGDNIYFATNDTVHKLWRIDARSTVITTYAGTGAIGFSGDGGPATSALIDGGVPFCDAHGNLYFSDGGNFRLRKIDTRGIITTIAGNGTMGSGGDGGPATSATIGYSNGGCVDSRGNVYFVDDLRIRKIDVRTGIISTVAGTGIHTPYLGDGIAATASNMAPFNVSVDRYDNLYIADFGNNRIEMVDASGLIWTIAGNGVNGFSGDGGLATAAKLNKPQGVCVDKCNNAYISDFGNKRLRKVELPGFITAVAIGGSSTVAVDSSVVLTTTVGGGCCYFKVVWLNCGIPFDTTTTTSVTYHKTRCTDSITAMVYGCEDSATSAVFVVGCAVNGVSPLPAAGNITIYPNPTHNQLHIEGSNLQSFHLINSIGTLAQTGPLQPGHNTLPTDGLPAGVYIVEVVTGEGVSRGRVVVE